MNKADHEELKRISELDGWNVRPALVEFLKKVVIDEKDIGDKRTESQHNSIFLWFGQIEKLAENEGITWDMIMRHTHQLKITKDGLHIMCKQLIEPLFGIKSTKKIEKKGQIDVIIDHFVDLFSKEGLELPPFPSKEENHVSVLEATKKREYPESHGDVKF